MSFPNRLARPGEMLVVHRFGCGAKGLASPAELSPSNPHSWLARLSKMWSVLHGNRRRPAPVTAVCVPHGTRLLVLDIPADLRHEINVQSTEEVTFRQMSESPFEYRDAIRFGNGRQILLQKLQEGQRVRILHDLDGLENQAGEFCDRLGSWQPDAELEPAA